MEHTLTGADCSLLTYYNVPGKNKIINRSLVVYDSFYVSLPLPPSFWFSWHTISHTSVTLAHDPCRLLIYFVWPQFLTFYPFLSITYLWFSVPPTNLSLITPLHALPTALFSFFCCFHRIDPLFSTLSAYQYGCCFFFLLSLSASNLSLLCTPISFPHGIRGPTSWKSHQRRIALNNS